MKPQRIVHLISSGGFFGAEQVILTLARTAPRLGLIPAILCFEEVRRPHLELVSRAAAEGIDARSFRCRRRLDPSSFSDLLSHLRDLKADLLHTHGAKANAYGLLAARKLGLPIVVTLHLWSPSPFSAKIYSWMDAVLFRFFDLVVAVSDDIAGQMVRRRVPQRLIRTIRNCVDVEALTRPGKGGCVDVRRALNIGGCSPVVGIVGRLTPEKGHRFFLNAAQKILRSIPDAVFVIVGSGYIEERLKAYAERLGISSSVRFAGDRQDMASFYDAFDLLVSCSLSEGTPMVILEAMAMGKPVVASRVGGVPSLIRQDETGLLVPPGDVPALAAAILELLRDRSRRERLACAGQRLVRCEFSAERMAKAYSLVYEEAGAANRWRRQET